MTWSVTTPPAEEPVTLDEAKLHLRVDVTDDDALITALLQAGREHVESVCERALMPQVWTERRSTFPGSLSVNGYLHEVRLDQLAVPLRGGLVRQVDSVKYIDADGVLQTLDPAAYVADLTTQPATVAPVPLTQWPGVLEQAGAVQIQYQVGYASAALVPSALKAAILLTVGDLYMNRAATVDQRLVENHAVDRLLTPYKRIMP